MTSEGAPRQTDRRSIATIGVRDDTAALNHIQPLRCVFYLTLQLQYLLVEHLTTRLAHCNPLALNSLIVADPLLKVVQAVQPSIVRQYLPCHMTLEGLSGRFLSTMSPLIIWVQKSILIDLLLVLIHGRRVPLVNNLCLLCQLVIEVKRIDIDLHWCILSRAQWLLSLPFHLLLLLIAAFNQAIEVVDFLPMLMLMDWGVFRGWACASLRGHVADLGVTVGFGGRRIKWLGPCEWHTVNETDRTHVRRVFLLSLVIHYREVIRVLGHELFELLFFVHFVLQVLVRAVLKQHFVDMLDFTGVFLTIGRLLTQWLLLVHALVGRGADGQFVIARIAERAEIFPGLGGCIKGCIAYSRWCTVIVDFRDRIPYRPATCR